MSKGMQAPFFSIGAHSSSNHRSKASARVFSEIIRSSTLLQQQSAKVIVNTTTLHSLRILAGTPRQSIITGLAGQHNLPGLVPNGVVPKSFGHSAAMKLRLCAGDDGAVDHKMPVKEV